jgi:hypothetical protein
MQPDLGAEVPASTAPPSRWRKRRKAIMGVVAVWAVYAWPAFTTWNTRQIVVGLILLVTLTVITWREVKRRERDGG